MQRFSLAILDPANKQQLWRLLQDMAAAIESGKQQAARLERELAAARSLTAADYIAINNALRFGGIAQLPITGLVGLAAEPQRAYALIADAVAGLPDPTVLEVGTIGAVLTAGIYQVYFVASGNPRTWQATTLTAPANMLTTDTNQTPGATVVKTWTAQQVFSGGLTSAAGLTVSAGQFNSASQFACRAYNSAAQSIPDAAITAFDLDSENFDQGGLHSTSVNTPRITIPTGGDGIWLLLGQASFAAAATGTRHAYIYRGGATQEASVYTPTLTPEATRIQVAAIVSAAVADYFELAGYQNSGGALNTVANQTWLSAYKLC